MTITVNQAVEKIAKAKAVGQGFNIGQKKINIPFVGYPDVIKQAQDWMLDHRHLATIWRPHPKNRLIVTGAMPVLTGDKFEDILRKYEKLWPEEANGFINEFQEMKKFNRSENGMSQGGVVRHVATFPPILYHILNTVKQAGGVDFMEGKYLVEMKEVASKFFNKGGIRSE